MSSLVSVIIPIYNTARYLPRCLESIRNSDYKNLEIICINDGSTDNCLEILQEYKNKDNRILVIDVPNGGVSKARNIGLDYATGDYICFIDSDDWIHRQFFSALLLFWNLFMLITLIFTAAIRTKITILLRWIPLKTILLQNAFISN